MPLVVPEPWTCVAEVEPDDVLRFRLTWTRPARAGERSLSVGVVMYNPALEGSALPDGSTLDGATHRRVRALLAHATEIRVANLSPVRGTKPAEARSLCRGWSVEVGWLFQADALRWACEPDIVVAGWGAGERTPRMCRSLDVVLQSAAGKLWCWGTTPGGDPLHPSPLGLVRPGAELQPFRR